MHKSNLMLALEDLMDRYEYGDEIMTPQDVMERLEYHLDENDGDDHHLCQMLLGIIRRYKEALQDYADWGGHCDDGSDEFIESLEALIPYDDE